MLLSGSTWLFSSEAVLLFMEFLKTHEGFQTAASLNLQGTFQSILIQIFEAIAHNVVMSQKKFVL